MESTGVYWKPIFNILEDAFEVILVNARHVKNVPGRKTDVKDSEWLCKLLRSGLVRGSFIPPKEIRELRDLTRYKRKLIQAIASEKQRIQKILEDANIKLSSVASNIFGASGTRIIEELMKGRSYGRGDGGAEQGQVEEKKRRPQGSARGAYGGTSYVHDQGVPGTYEGNRRDPLYPGTEDCRRRSSFTSRKNTNFFRPYRR